MNFERTGQSDINHVLNCALISLDRPLIICDKDGIVLYASDYHLKYLGYERTEDMVGHLVSEVIPGTRMTYVLNSRVSIYGSLFHFVHRKTGAVTTVVCNYTPIYDKSEFIGVMCQTIFPDDLTPIHTLTAALRNRELRQTSGSPLSARKQAEQIILGTSSIMAGLRQQVIQTASFPLPVLITGETGTGKEVFANAIHQLSSANYKNFVKINCAAIPDTLLESELFGYERGTFSGANREGKIGKFEYADGGTVLLDEIGDMPLNLQAKLLRVIQEKEFERLGGVKRIPFTARIICTTNRNIEPLVSQQLFRQDLYYRINTIEICIPPLRERMEDIEVLSAAFIRDINIDYGLSVAGLNSEALQQLKMYDWPGNVRELRHTIERACVLTGVGMIQPERINFNIRLSGAEHKSFAAAYEMQECGMIEREADVVPLSEARKRAEKIQINRALEKTHGNKTVAAKLLGIDRSILYGKLRKYNL